MNDNKNQTNNSTNVEATRVSSMEEMLAILDGEAIKITENGKTKFFYLKGNEIVEVAHQIAETYLQQFPRPNTYGAHLSSSECDNTLTIFHELTEEEFAVVSKWKEEAFEEGEMLFSLGEYLMGDHDELFEKLMENDSPLALDTLDSVDLENPLKFTKFSVQLKVDNDKLGHRIPIPCPLTDEEFVELLTYCLLEKNQISMNMMVYRKPEIAKRIIEHLIWAYYDFRYECYEPSICELDELKSVTQSILDPSVDILHLIDSEDIKIKAFLKGHKIVV